MCEFQEKIWGSRRLLLRHLLYNLALGCSVELTFCSGAPILLSHELSEVILHLSCSHLSYLRNGMDIATYLSHCH